ncbi:MAG: ABC transporter ATP-binding protein, partial [Geminicoccaceae bacterium]
FSSLTVAQNIQVPMRERLRLSPRLLNELAGLKLALVGLPLDACGRYPSELSGGMRKRAGLARALALDPQLLFLDEPTAGLDPIGAAEFDRLIRRLQQSLGLTVIMVTHDLDSLQAICDRVAALVDKRAVVGTLEQLRNLHHPWLRAYFHGPRGRAAAHAAKEDS